MMDSEGSLAREMALSLHFIYHVPKCAGRTIDCHLAAELGPKVYCRITKQNGFSNAIGPAGDQIRAVGGHLLGPATESKFRGREVKRSILLRDPVSHLVSYYNFRMMRYLSQGLRPYSFDLAYRATQRNFISHYILRNFLNLSWYRLVRLSDPDKYDLVNAFLATFWYVGDYRLCDDLVSALSADLDICPRAKPRNTRQEWERRIPWQSLTLDELSPHAMDQIRNENVLDQEVWETWRQARCETKVVRPHPLAANSAPRFLISEMRRLGPQIIRRLRRRGVSFAQRRAEAAEGARLNPLDAVDPFSRSPS
jgi:hypothetical protein